MRLGGAGWERMKREQKTIFFKEMESEGSEATVDLFG